MHPSSGYWSCGRSLGMIVPDLWYVGGESVVITVVGDCECDIDIYEVAVCCGWEAYKPVV